jgi:hypothetical protein
MAFCPRSPEISKVGTLTTLGPIILCEDLRLTWSLKQRCSPHRDLFNGMSHATCTRGNRDDYWLLMVRNQIANLTLDLLLAITCVSNVQMGHASPF